MTQCRQSKTQKVAAVIMSILCSTLGFSRQPVVSFASGDKNIVKLKFQVQKKVPFGKQVSIVGSNEVFGAWDPKNALSLRWSDNDVWQGEAELSSG